MEKRLRGEAPPPASLFSYDACESTAGRVLSTIAQFDFDRALAIAFETSEIARYPTISALPVKAHLERMPAFADRLASAGESHAL